MKVLKYLGIAMGALVLVALVVWLVRTDPMGPVSGKRLSGDERAFAEAANVVDEHMLCAVETRPDDPHSVTTLCFMQGGRFIVPAMGGTKKSWPQYASADSRVRVKIGEHVYPGTATRLIDVDTDAMIAAIVAKYPQYADRDPADAPTDVWFFEISSR